jgi:hypothetical protein
MNTPLIYRLYVLVAVLLLSGTMVSGAQGDDITLYSVSPVDVMVIEKNTLKLRVDLVFDRYPDEYWFHYNRNAGRLVLEFFGIHVNASKVKIRDTSVIADLKVVNGETAFALNGKNAQISMRISEGWHYRSQPVGDKVLRLFLWKPLNPARTFKTKKKKPLLPVLIISVVAAGITAAVLFVVK